MMRSKPVATLQRSVAVAFFGALAIGTALSQQAPGKVDFRRDVLPILKQHCIGCHGPTQQMHNLRLDRRRDAMKGGTVLAIKPGNSEISRLYLKLVSNEYGPQMPLTGPLSQDQIDVIKAWIDQGAEWPDELSGDTPSPPTDPRAAQVMDALRDGDRAAFEKLAKDDPAVGSRRGPDGTTPLMQAVLYGDADSVRLLLAGGGDPNIPNDAGATALMWAVSDAEKTRLLLEHGADVNAVSADGRTPLLAAVSADGNVEVVKLLLDRGADVSAKSPTGIGYATVLSEAARTNDGALVRLIVERGADVKSAGPGPLLNSSRCPECFDMLADRADKSALTPALLVFALRGDSRSMRAMLERGADPNARDRFGDTVLMLAASADAVPAEGVRALIERGADVNAKTPEGKTALDFARERGSTPVADLLASAGAKEGEPRPEPTPRPRPAASVRAALERSIPLLQRSAATFTEKALCVSCHNNSLTAVTVSVARRNGFSVDERIARDQLKRIGSYLGTLRERYLQNDVIGGGPAATSYILFGLAAENYPSDETTDAMARVLRSQQMRDGRWQWLMQRQPIEPGDDIPFTALALKGLRAYAPKPQRAEYEAAAKRAADWLARAQPRTTQDRAFQLLGLGWAGVSPSDEVVRRAARELVREQRPDGGWAQLPSMASDAYATGQALVALRQAGGVGASDPAYKRGVEYLLKTQLEDGSWFVRTRAIPLQPYFESGFPHGRNQWISAAATNWASTALALGHHAPPRERERRRAGGSRSAAYFPLTCPTSCGCLVGPKATLYSES